MLWRNRLIIVSLLVLLPITSRSQVVTDGASLKKRCASLQLTMPSAGLGCRGYIGAVADILADGNSIYNYRACPPAGKKREALVKTVKNWLASHSGELRQRASAVIAQSLAEAYPCAKN